MRDAGESSLPRIHSLFFCSCLQLTMSTMNANMELERPRETRLSFVYGLQDDPHCLEIDLHGPDSEETGFDYTCFECLTSSNEDCLADTGSPCNNIYLEAYDLPDGPSRRKLVLAYSRRRWKSALLSKLPVSSVRESLILSWLESSRAWIPWACANWSSSI